MLVNLFFALAWVSGGLAIGHALPTWIFVLYGFISVVSFFAWALVRGGSLASAHDE